MTAIATPQKNTAGFLKIFRKLQNWQWFNDANTLATLIHCIFRANTQKSEWKGLTLRRGQFVTSRSELAKEIGISEREVRTALERLTKCQTIDQQTTNRYTLITVLNYAKYQHADKPSRPAKRQPNASQTTTVIEDIYVVVDNITRARFFEDFFSPNRQAAIEQLCIARGFGSIENFKRLCNDVLAEWESINLHHSDIREARQHLINQCYRKMQIRQSEQKKSTNQNTSPNDTKHHNPASAKNQRTQAFTEHIIDKLNRPRPIQQPDFGID